MLSSRSFSVRPPAKFTLDSGPSVAACGSGLCRFPSFGLYSTVVPMGFVFFFARNLDRTLVFVNGKSPCGLTYRNYISTI